MLYTDATPNSGESLIFDIIDVGPTGTGTPVILAEIVVDNGGIEAATYNGFPTTSAGDLLTMEITDVSYNASANNAVWTFTY